MNRIDYGDDWKAGVLGLFDGPDTELRTHDAMAALLRELRKRKVFSMLAETRERSPAPLALAAEVVEAGARFDGSLGWLLVTGICTTFSLRVAEAFPEAFSSGEYAASVFRAGTATAHRDAEGYRISGKWRFCTGASFADWIAVGVNLYEGDKPVLSSSGKPKTAMAILPQKEVRILDTAETIGLGLSETRDIALENARVPPSWVGTNPFSLYRPFFVLWTGFAALGIARAALDGWKASLARNAGRRERAATEFARAEAAWRAARAYAYGAIPWVEEATARARFDEREVRDAALPTANAAVTAKNIVHAAFYGAGSSSVFVANRMARISNDALTMLHHISLGEDVLEHAGKGLLES
ncbi:hypothetical protein LZC95_31185 [Pendulispora brunnea]|uniref:Acyl-CoA dehydrogenase C-terminal domain-containing protein n=1 Tax=Pendulispora brunnea TaxID=2905690 RepID=A0ABZ2K149_9BACT